MSTEGMRKKIPFQNEPVNGHSRTNAKKAGIKHRNWDINVLQVKLK